MRLYLLLFVIPLLYAIIHAKRAIKYFPTYAFIAFGINDFWTLTTWFRELLWNIAHFIITNVLLYQMAEKHRDYIRWEIAVARNLIESYVVADIVDKMCHVSSDHLFEMPPNEQIPYYILIAFFIAGHVQWYSPEFAIVIAGFAAKWLVYYAIFEKIHRRKVEAIRKCNEVSPLHEIRARSRMNRLWKVIAIVRPTNNVYLTKQFFPVTSESNNGSSILVLEKWQYGSTVRFVTVWRLSMINGLQKKVHEFRFDDYGDDFRLQGFESQGLIIIVEYGFDMRIFVYDQRSGKAATFRWHYWRNYWGYRPLDGTCLRRHTDSNGTVRGWRIRIVDNRLVPCECHPEENWDARRRPSLCVTIIDLRPDLSTRPIIVHQKELVIGPCHRPWSIPISFLRTGRGVVGLIHRIRDDTTVYFFNRHDSTFGSIPISELCKIDRSFGKYFYTPAPGERFLLEGARQRDLMPVVLSEDECIEVDESGVIWRSMFRAPTLLRLNLEAMFREYPELALEMSAIEFQAATGIGDCEHAFST